MTEKPDFPRPSNDPVQAPFWAALANGHLQFQRCGACQHAFLPARTECPACLAAEPGWETASGKASLVSWVIYHRAFHPAFADRLPYAVAIVELAEGPRMISNIIGAAPEQLRIDAPLELVIEWEEEVSVPRFRLAVAE